MRYLQTFNIYAPTTIRIVAVKLSGNSTPPDNLKSGTAENITATGNSDTVRAGRFWLTTSLPRAILLRQKLAPYHTLRPASEQDRDATHLSHTSTFRNVGSFAEWYTRWVAFWKSDSFAVRMLTNV